MNTPATQVSLKDKLFWTDFEIHEMTGLPLGTIRRLVKEGIFPQPLKEGGKNLWPAAAVRAWNPEAGGAR